MSRKYAESLWPWFVSGAPAVVAMAVLWLAGAAAAAAGEVTVAPAAVSGQSALPGWGKQFAERLNARPGWTAKLVKHDDWTSSPAAPGAAGHVNLLELQFGNRSEYLAVFFAPEGGGIDCIARVPALQGQTVKYFFSPAPGDRQLPRNAPTDLVAEFVHMHGGRAAVSGAVQVEMENWQDAAGAGDSGPLPLGAAESAMLRPLACAAVYAAGRRPVPASPTGGGAQAGRLFCAFRKAAGGYDLRVRLEGGASHTEHGVVSEALFDTLTIALHNILDWNGALTDLAPLPGNFTPLAVRPEAADGKSPALLLGMQGAKNSGLAAFAPGSDKPVWQRKPVGDEKLLNIGGVLLAGNGASFSRINPDTGIAEAPAGGEAAGGPNSCLLGGLFLAWDEAGVLTARRDGASGEPAWQAAAGEALLAAPAIIGGRLLVATGANRLLLLEPADGKVAKEKTWPTWLLDVRVIAGEPPLIACVDQGNRLTLLDSGLEELRRLPLPFRMQPWSAAPERFPGRWQAGDDIPDAGIPAYLLADQKARLYIFNRNKLR